MLVTLLLLLVLGGYLYARYRYNQVHKFNVGGLAGEVDNHPTNILMVGDNCRSCLNGKQSNAFGTGSQVAGGRSDVLMVLHLNPQNKSASLLSIPRDTWLPIPGTSKETRVDDALNQGPTALVQTVQQDLGIPINHYVELNFDSFQSVVLALGGVDMYFPVAVYDSYSALNVPAAGCYALNGFQALAVVRARHMYYLQGGRWRYDGNGDLSRIARDHEFLRVLASSVVARGLGNPLTDNSLIGSVAPQLAVDSQLSLSNMVGLVLNFHSVNPNNIPQFTLPIQADPNSYVYEGSSYGSVVFPVWPQDQQVIDQFLGVPASNIPAPSGVTVQVLNGSGGANQASRTAKGLESYGYQITNIGDTSIVAQPDETLVRYSPRQLGAAQALARKLSGNVALAQANLPTGTALQVVTGSYLAVTPPPTASSSSSTTSTGSTSSTALTPASEPQSSLPGYDPTACPAGSKAIALSTSVPTPKGLPSG